MRRLCRPEIIPVPEGFPVLYAHADVRDTAPVIRGYTLVGEPEVPASRAVLKSGGYRLASLGVPGPMPEKAYEGYDYATTDPISEVGQVVHGRGDFRDKMPVAIRLSALNDVYVVDNAAFRQARSDYWDAIPEAGRREHRVSDGALGTWVAATARTMVPAQDYDGTYETPVYLIGRVLAENEAHLVKGTVRVIHEYLGDGPKV